VNLLAVCYSSSLWKPTLDCPAPKRSLLASLLVVILYGVPHLVLAQAPAVPEWAQPGSPTHKQVAPPPDFHRPSRNFDTPIGMFQGQSDIGAAVLPGSANYDASTKQYTINSAGVRVFPALGNHEFHGDPQQCLENWWEVFPEMRNRRWYSAQLGSRVYVITLDSDASLMPESDQARWLKQQLSSLPITVDFVIFSLHHPPVADIQTHLEVNHNPRPNEITLRDYLSTAAQQVHARFIVSAGHIHNYERQMKDDVLYLVSGGGGAKPYFVERTPDDLYKSMLFPNYHYVKFTLEKDRLHGVMIRVSDPEASTPAYAVKDSFDVVIKSTSVASR
jgi:hypothetical protein